MRRSARTFSKRPTSLWRPTSQWYPVISAFPCKRVVIVVFKAPSSRSLKLPDLPLEQFLLGRLLHLCFVVSVFPLQLLHFLFEEMHVFSFLLTQCILSPLALQHLQLILVISLVSPLPFMPLLLRVSSFKLMNFILVKVHLSLFFIRPLLLC